MRHGEGEETDGALHPGHRHVDRDVLREARRASLTVRPERANLVIEADGKGKSVNQMERDSLLAAAKQLCDLMYRWNVIDVHKLVVDDARNGGSVYHHTNKALERALGHLGLHETSTFYDLVTQGEPPVEALEKALEVQADHVV
jgi:hypothetical protein